MQENITLQPVILAGGSGTRLWPLSRESFPKQYINLNSDNPLSLLQRTQKRLKGIKNIENPIIICNEEQRFIVAEQMREINIKPKRIILEPFGKNTAPAIAIAALDTLNKNKESVLLILSSDHEIKDPVQFKKVINEGIKEAKKNLLITFGIIPTSPETGYGYIQTSNFIDPKSIKPTEIKSFIEKPNLELAKKLIDNRNYLWNSGIFVFQASTIIDELEIYQPSLMNACRESYANSTLDFDFLRLSPDSFEKCQNLSIDVAVMEKTRRANVIVLDAGWDDLGNWHSLWNNEKKDKNGNVTIGDVLKTKVKNSYLKSDKKLLVAIGIENLIIVQTSDATLVANNKDTQEIKNIVKKLNSEKRSEGKVNTKIFRPWGYYNLIEKGLNWQVKEISVNPKSSLSMQKHNFRSEHWIILKGNAKVEINKNEIFLNENQSTYIPIGAKHRLSNISDENLILIEVQCGEYLGEDDIIRYSDNYGRVN